MFSFFKIITTGLLLSGSMAVLAGSNLSDDRGEANGLATAAYALSDTNLSCRTDSDCLTFSMGSRSCGGPSRFILVSQNNPHKNAIEELAQILTEKEKKMNKEHDLVSVCSVLIPPSVSCQGNKCVAF